MKNLFGLKDKSIESIIASYEKFLKLHTDGSFQDEFRAYKNYLLNILTAEDFKKLNEHIFQQIQLKQITEGIYSLIILMRELNKLDTSWAAIVAKNEYGADVVKKALVKAKLDINAKDNNGNTPLILAVAANRVGAVKLLIEAGADINAKNIFAETAFTLASKAGHEGIIKLLIDAGAKKPRERIKIPSDKIKMIKKMIL